MESYFYNTALSPKAVSCNTTSGEAWARGAQDWLAPAGGGPQDSAGDSGGSTAHLPSRV